MKAIVLIKGDQNVGPFNCSVWKDSKWTLENSLWKLKMTPKHDILETTRKNIKVYYLLNYILLGKLLENASQNTLKPHLIFIMLNSSAALWCCGLYSYFLLCSSVKENGLLKEWAHPPWVVENWTTMHMWHIIKALNEIWILLK